MTGTRSQNVNENKVWLFGIPVLCGSNEKVQAIAVAALSSI